jgi:hypothetical protein
MDKKDNVNLTSIMVLRLFAIFNLWKQEKISEIQSMGMGILLTDKEEHSLPRTNTLPYPETLT